jgi:Uri superfamily endonuclease
MQPGTYILVLKVEQPLRLKIGALGTFAFPAGYYLYVGSALNGLAGRLRRHLRREKPPRWHVDYLRRHADLAEIWYTISDERLECRWAAAARALPGANLPAPRFGASDCACPAHLVHLPAAPNLEAFQAQVTHQVRVLQPPNYPPI